MVQINRELFIKVLSGLKDINTHLTSKYISVDLQKKSRHHAKMKTRELIEELRQL